MNGNAKAVRLSLVFVFSGLLTILCIARASIDVPPEISKYLDIVMAVLIVVLLLCVLELCLGVRLCGDVWCSRHERSGDVDEGRGGINESPTPESSEAPPSYDIIMEQGLAHSHTGAAEGGRERGREHESMPLKRDFSFYFNPPASYDSRLPPMRPPSSSSSGVRETSFVSPAELWLAVDSLPTYEEAVARLREEVATVQEGEEGTVNQHVEGAELTQVEENAAGPIREVEETEQQKEQALAGLREEGRS